MLILLLVAVSTYGDLTARFYILRFLMPRRRTRNVTSAQPRPDSGARVILTANHDAPRSGLLWVRRRRTGQPRRRPRRLLASLAGPGRHLLLDGDGRARRGACRASGSASPTR